MNKRMRPADSALARNTRIDLLRGIAILLVALHHLAIRMPLRDTQLGEALPRWMLDGLSYSGFEAVYMFFVLSGYLIASRSLTRWPDLGSLPVREFYRMRAARILPCLLGLLVILTVLHLLAVPYYQITRPEQTLAGALMSAVGFYLNVYEGRTGWLPGGWDVLWSLSVEEGFYVLFPWVCLLTKNRRVLALGLLVFAATLPIWRIQLAGQEIWQEKAYLPGGAAIAMGIFGALMLKHWQPSRWVGSACTAVGGLGVVSVVFASRAVFRALGEASLLCLCVSTLLLVIGSVRAHASTTSWVGWLTTPLRSWGRLSYEIYLTHMFVVFALLWLFNWKRGEGPVTAWAYLLLLPLSWMLGRFVERYWSTPWRSYILQRPADPNGVRAQQTTTADRV